MSFANTLRDVEDITWSTYGLDVWSGAELFCIIVCSSIPPLHIFWKKFSRNRSLERNSNSSIKSSRHLHAARCPGEDANVAFHPASLKPNISFPRDDDIILLQVNTFQVDYHHQERGQKIKATTEISVSSSDADVSSSRGLPR